MGRVIWTDPAALDVENIRDYIARDSTLYAARFCDKLVNSVTGLARSPRSGGRVLEFDVDHYREIVVWPYRVIYEIRGEDCYVVAVIHGSRDLVKLIKPPKA